jgi:hypothetical protein
VAVSTASIGSSSAAAEVLHRYVDSPPRAEYGHAGTQGEVVVLTEQLFLVWSQIQT